MIVDGHLFCEPCGRDVFEPTIYRNVMGTGANLVRCVACGAKCYDRQVATCAGAHDNDVAHRMAEQTLRTGGMCATDPAKAEEMHRHHVAYYSTLLQTLRQHAGEVTRLYEVGTGLGAFLDVARSAGVPGIGGCEINRRGVELTWAHRLITVEHALFQDATVPANLDAVVMLDMIEHTATPRADLEKALRHLRAGGGLLLKTFYDEWHADQNLDLVSHYASNHGYFGPDQHVHHFDQLVIRALIERVGFRIRETAIDAVWGQITVFAVKPA